VIPLWLAITLAAAGGLVAGMVLTVLAWRLHEEGTIVFNIGGAGLERLCRATGRTPERALRRALIVYAFCVEVTRQGHEVAVVERRPGLPEPVVVDGLNNTLLGLDGAEP
jgi:hypothetical protein